MWVRTISSIDSYAQALWYDPHQPHIYLQLAETYLLIGGVDKAKEAARSAARLDRTNPDAFLLLARIHTTLDDYASAKNAYARAIELSPKNENAIMAKAALHADLGEYSEAIVDLERVVALRGEQAFLAYYFLGKIHATRGDFKQAISAYEESLKANPSFYSPAQSLGRLYELQSDRAKALEFYKYALAYDPTDEETQERIAMLLVEEEQYEEALNHYKEIFTRNPINFNAKLKAGLLNYQLKRFPEAKALFEEILSLNPGSDRVRFYLAVIREEEKDYKGAVSEYAKIVTESSYYVQARLHAGYIYYMNLKNVDQALLTIRDALSKKPRERELVLYLVSILEKERRYNEALSELNHAIERFPSDADILYSLGSVYDKNGRFDEAVGIMEQILRLDENHVNALNFIGYSFVERGVKLDRAEMVLVKAYKLNPKNGYVVDSLGWLYFKTGRYRQAIEKLETAVKLAPSEPVILEHLADAYKQRADTKQALKFYNLALTNNTEEERADRLMKKIRGVQGLH